MQHLITAELLNAWIKYMQADDEYQCFLEGEFVNILNRSNLKTETFHFLVKLHSEGKSNLNDPEIPEILQIISGGVWDVKGSAHRKISGVDFVLSCKPDVIKGPAAYKITSTTKYTTGDYFHNSDHMLCFECFPGIQSFEYVGTTGKNVYTEKYSRNDHQNMYSLLCDFRIWLSVNSDYEKTYFEKWNQDSIAKEKQDYIDRMYNQVVNQRVSELKRDVEF